MTIETIKQEFAELIKERDEIIRLLDLKEKEIKNSDEYKKAEKEHQRLEKESDKLYDGIRNKENSIKEEFLHNIGGYYESPSYSKAYGININPEVIDAIKKTFDFKRLSGSAIESIVQKMMRHKQIESKEIKSLEDEKRKIDAEKERFYNELSEIESKYTKELNQKLNANNLERREKEQQLALLQMNEGEKIEDVPNYVKKNVLEKYRRECENNFMKVFENLKDK